MTNAEKKMNKYTRAIGRRLNMPKEVKVRVIDDFISSIQGRREAGQTDEEIFAELGSAKKVAAELNEQMKEYTYTKSPWRWACLALAIGCAVFLLFGGASELLLYLLNKSINSTTGIIGGADGPTAIFISTSSDFSQQATYRTVFAVIMLLMGILGFYRLSRCPKE